MLGLIGLKLLGGFKFLGNFISQNWKWILPIVLVIGAVVYHRSAVSDAYSDGYVGGVTDEKAAWVKRIEEENKKNREFEQLIQNAINNFGKSIAEDTAKRVSAETKLKETVQTIIKDNPVYEQCVVDQEVIEARNQIRALGPVRVEMPDAQ